MKTTSKLTTLLILFLMITGQAQAADGFLSTEGGARYKELKTGAGENAHLGDVATIHFVGWLDNNGVKGKEIYNTRKEAKQVSFVVGTDKIMQGWNEGVIGMKQGGKRLLKIPPALGYGNKGVQGVIPSNASLIFIIDLVGLEKSD